MADGRSAAALGLCTLLLAITACGSSEPLPEERQAILVTTTTTAPTTTTTAPNAYPAGADPDDRHVAVVADSLVACCLPSWTSGHLVATHPTAIWAYGGTVLPVAVGWLTRLDPAPEVVVVAQGANNARDGWVPTDRDALLATIAAVPTAPCVVVVNYAAAPWSVPLLLEGAAAGNADVAAIDAADDRVVVADWATAAAGAPEWFRPDGLHLTDVGAAAYQALVTAAVSSCP